MVQILFIYAFTYFLFLMQILSSSVRSSLFKFVSPVVILRVVKTFFIHVVYQLPVL